MPDEQRVNVWPLFYKSQDATSLLWPIVDWDKEGFAVRPVINKEKDDWSILFPASSWNTERDEGWFLTAYRAYDSTGLFPVLHIEDDSDDVRYIFPVWWNDSGKQHGILPLYGMGDDFTHVGPIWWTEKNAMGVFPIYGQKVAADYSRRNVLFGMAASFRTYGNGNRTQWVAPLYYAQQQGEKRTRFLLPLYWSQSNKNESMFITPLGGRGQSKDGNTEMRNIGGPLYHYHRTGDHSYHAFLWPVFARSDQDTWRIWPLYSRTGEQPTSDPMHEMVLLHNTVTENHRKVSCLEPFVFGYDRRITEQGVANTRLEFLMFGSIWDNTYDNRGVPPPASYNWQPHIKSKGRHFIAAYKKHNTYRAWTPGVLSDEEMRTLHTWASYPSALQNKNSQPEVIAILKRHGVTPASDSAEDIQKALMDFADAHTHEYTQTTSGIPFIFKLKQEENAHDWSLLFGAMKSKREDERSSFRILKLLYSRERDGDTISRDFFPFVAWDSAPDRSRLSFLWRVFDYRRSPDGTKGHLLFIPWGQ